MKKYIANILTATRVVLSIFLLVFYDKVDVSFLIIFTIAAFTDMIDGTIARKTNSSSLTGSILDTIADVLLSLNIMKVAIISGLLQGTLLVWLIFIFVVALISPVITYIKFKKVYFVHSILAKIVGGLIYDVPYSIYFNFFNTYLIFVLVMFSLAMIHSLFINIFSKEADSNTKTLLSAIKNNKKTGDEC